MAPATVLRFDLQSSSWRPESVQALVAEVREVLGQQVSAEEADDLDWARVVSSCGGGACAAAATGDDGEAEAPEFVDVVLPERLALASHNGRPGILATGQLDSTFRGALRQAGGDAPFTIRFYDCGHFLLVERVPRAPVAFRNMALEGRWQLEGRKAVLDCLVRYPVRADGTKPAPSAGALGLEAVTQQARRAVMSVAAGNSRIHGLLPLVNAGGALQVHADAVKDPPMTMVSAAQGGRTEELAENSGQEDASKVAEKQLKVSTKVVDDNTDSEDEVFKQMLRPEGMRVKQREQSYSRYDRNDDDNPWDSEEPTWPMYLGIFLFIVVFASFGYLFYLEKFAPEVPQEFDEL